MIFLNNFLYKVEQEGLNLHFIWEKFPLAHFPGQAAILKWSKHKEAEFVKRGL